MSAKSLQILFVDKNLPDMQELRKKLPLSKPDWEIQHQENVIEALELLRKDHIDIVVAEMDLPGISGIEFLSRVREKNPETIRLILSDPADQDSILQQALLVAHQSLTTPCSVEKLVTTISRIDQLQQLMKNEDLRSLVAGIDRLPSLPDLYVSITRELQSADPQLEEVIELIQRDPALCIKILQLVNSGFFAMPHKVSSVVEASNFLGVETLQSVVLFSGIYDQVESTGSLAISYEDFSQHALEVGHLATELSDRLYLPILSRKEAFTAGILHDLGKLVFAIHYRDQYARILQAAKSERRSLSHLEKEIFGVTHGELGSYLLTLWGLPSSLAEAVAFHSKPSLCSHREPCTLVAIHIADVLSKWNLSRSTEPTLESFDAAYLEETKFAQKISRCIELRQEMGVC